MVPFTARSSDVGDGEYTLVEKPISTQKGADLQLRRMSDSPLNDSVVQCLNTGVGTVHLFVNGAFKWKEPKTLCGRWACGAPDRPVKTAMFSATSTEWTGRNCKYGFCEACYGDCYPAERCSPSPRKAKGSVPAADLESDSSSSSSSDSE